MKGIKFCGSENCCICEESLSLRTENKRLTDLCTATRHELNRLALKLSPKGECLLDNKDAEIERLREAAKEARDKILETYAGVAAGKSVSLGYGIAAEILRQALREQD